MIIFPASARSSRSTHIGIFGRRIPTGSGANGSILVRPSRVQAGRSANQSLTVSLAGAGWTSGTTFTLSGVSGVTKIAQVVDNGGLAKIVITTTGASITSIGTLTVSDGTNTGTTQVRAVAPNYRRWFAGLRRKWELPE